MIDWLSVALNAFWIAGLAVILAAFSYHQWLAAETSRRLPAVLTQPSWKIPYSAGMLLTCLGFGFGVTTRWWERTAWTLLALSYAFELSRNLGRKRQSHS